MTLDQAIRVVQMAYPQVYLACHTRHQRKRSTEHHLSPRDAAILSHLDEREGTVPARLARHLGVTRSTLSEALKRLTTLGYVRRGADAGEAKRGSIVLTGKGAAAIRDTSVLETKRLDGVLSTLSARELIIVTKGLHRLAAACRDYADRRSTVDYRRARRSA